MNKRYNYLHLSPQLFVQFWYIIIPFSLVQISSNGITQLVLLSKAFDGEFPTIISRFIGQFLLSECDFPILFVNQEHVSVQACSLWRAGSNILGKSVSFSDVSSGDVANQPVVPLTELGVLSARRVWVSHAQSVQSPRIRSPGYFWDILYLCGCKGVSIIYADTAGVGYFQNGSRSL